MWRSAEIDPQDHGPPKWHDGPHLRMPMRSAHLGRRQKVGRSCFITGLPAFCTANDIQTQ